MTARLNKPQGIGRHSDSMSECPKNIVDTVSLIDKIRSFAGSSLSTDPRAEKDVAQYIHGAYFRQLENAVTTIVSKCVIKEPKDMDFWNALGNVGKALDKGSMEDTVFHLDELKERMREIKCPIP